MGILQGNEQSSGNTFRSLPIRLPVGIGVFMAGPLLRRVAGQPLTQARLVDLTQSIPLHEATVGARAIRRGERENDTNLTEVGAAMIATAVVKARNSGEVPRAITQQVVNLAMEHSIDPVANPMVSAERADAAVQIMEELSSE